MMRSNYLDVLRSKHMKFIQAFLVCLILNLFLSCGQSGGNAPDALSTPPPSTPVGGTPNIPTDGTSFFALTYGSSAQDRQFLADRIAGYQAPGLSEVFSNWRRIAGGNLYNTPSEIVQTPIYCFTGFDANQNWLPGTNPNNGQAITPGTFSNCVNSNDFVSASWSFIKSPDRLYNAANGTSFNGFISGLKFVNFSLESEISSTNTDDDGIGLIIAANIDSSHVIHTLTALRSQGGVVPTQGWGIVYRQNNTIINTFGAISIGGVNTNGSQGDRLGWNGRRSLVRVERADNLITAYTSNWRTSGTTLALDQASKIEIDLSNVSNNLSIFQGEQYYGYGTISQLGANFSRIALTTPNAESDPTYIYDLLNNLVYNKLSAGGYVLVNGSAAYTTIGFPKRVKNTETQKEFVINSASSYTEL